MIGGPVVKAPPALPEHPGLREVAALLQLISDPEKYNAALGEIEAKRAEVNELIAKVGKASEIDTLHEDAKKAHEAACQLLEKAKEDAETMLASYRMQANTLVAEAQQQADELTSRFQQWHAKLEQRQTNIDRADASMRERESKVTRRENDSTERDKTLTDREQSVQNREAEANRMIEGFNGVLRRQG